MQKIGWGYCKTISTNQFYVLGMKSRRIMYLAIGCILIILNLIIDILSLDEYRSNDTLYGIGYFIGSHILMIIGIVFIRFAYKINRKIKAKDEGMDEEIERIGSK